MQTRKLLVAAALLSMTASVQAKVKLLPIFSDNMVLQQQTAAPLWGEAKAGKTVKIVTSWDKKTYTTRAGADGKWRIDVQTPVAGGPYEVSISDGKLFFRDKQVPLKMNGRDVTDDKLIGLLPAEAVQNAQANAHAAGVAQYIQFHACDFASTPIPAMFSVTREASWKYRGCIFFNPEYGIRLGDPAELAPVYERIGTFMNEKCKGYVGAVLTGSPELSKLVNLYYVTRIPFYNGPIDCRLFIYPNCELKGENVANS